MCIICKASFAKTNFWENVKCFFFFNQTYLIYLFLFMYYDICLHTDTIFILAWTKSHVRFMLFGAL